MRTSRLRYKPPERSVQLKEFGQQVKASASEIGSVHTKAWIVPPKVEPKPVERQAKGHCATMLGGVRAEFDTPEEMLKAMWEDTDTKLAGYRFPDQESFKTRQKQTGKGIWSNELVAKILKLNHNLFVEDSINVPGCAAFYKTVDGEKAPAGGPIASFRKGFIPEFTIIETDKADLPIKFTYGWRTVLMRLVKTKDLTLKQINSVWGDVHYGDERAKHYDAYMREWKI